MIGFSNMNSPRSPTDADVDTTLSKTKMRRKMKAYLGIRRTGKSKSKKKQSIDSTEDNMSKGDSTPSPAPAATEEKKKNTPVSSSSGASKEIQAAMAAESAFASVALRLLVIPKEDQSEVGRRLKELLHSVADGAFVPLMDNCLEDGDLRKLCALRGIATDEPAPSTQDLVKREDEKEEKQRKRERVVFVGNLPVSADKKQVRTESQSFHRTLYFESTLRPKI